MTLSLESILNSKDTERLAALYCTVDASECGHTEMCIVMPRTENGMDRNEYSYVYTTHNATNMTLTPTSNE